MGRFISGRNSYIEGFICGRIYLWEDLSVGGFVSGRNSCVCMCVCGRIWD